MQYSFLDQLAGFLMLGFLVYLSYKNFYASPEQFSAKNINKSLTTMALLALGLMGFVYILIQMVGSGDTYIDPMKEREAAQSDYDDEFSTSQRNRDYSI